MHLSTSSHISSPLASVHRHVQTHSKIRHKRAFATVFILIDLVTTSLCSSSFQTIQNKVLFVFCWRDLELAAEMFLPSSYYWGGEWGVADGQHTS